MDAPETVRGLANIRLQPTPDPAISMLTLIDTAGRESSVLLSPDALSVLLERVLIHAIHRSSHPDTQLPATIVRCLAGTEIAIPAHNMRIEHGRTARECAVKLHAGEALFSFLIPLDKVISATADLVARIEPAPDGKAH